MVGVRFLVPVQNGPGAHPAPCGMGTWGLSPGGRNVLLTPDPYLALRLKEE